MKLSRPFYLGLHEVNNEQYQLFDKQHSSGTADGAALDGPKQPVVNVSWEQAALYCNWLSSQDSLPAFYQVEGGKVVGSNQEAIGYRLATEAEWAWAARVVEGGNLLKFPWGETMPPTENSGNFADLSAGSMLGRVVGNYRDGYVVSAPVGSFNPAGNGLFDMGGNVSEWVNDYYGIVASFGAKEELNPMGPVKGEFRVIRGSSWAHGTITELRLSYRDYSMKPRNDLGFRIARYLE